MDPFQIFTKIRGDIRNFVFIASVFVTGGKISAVSLTSVIVPDFINSMAGYNDTGDNLSPVTTTTAIIYLRSQV